jgi:hypothetical protein
MSCRICQFPSDEGENIRENSFYSRLLPKYFLSIFFPIGLWDEFLNPVGLLVLEQ